MDKLIITDKRSCISLTDSLKEWFPGPRLPVDVSDSGWENLQDRKYKALMMTVNGSADSLRINLLVDWKQQAISLSPSQVITVSFDGETLILKQTRNGRERVIEIKKTEEVQE